MSTSTPFFIATASQVATTGSDAAWFFAQRTNTDTATNLNNLTPTEVPVDGPLLTSGTGWAINGNGIELTGLESLVRVSMIVHVTAAFNRGNMQVRLALNGVPFGPISACGYIRNNNGHQESSYSIPGTWTKMLTGDVITIQSLREANAGTITMAQAGTSQLLLERLVNV